MIMKMSRNENDDKAVPKRPTRLADEEFAGLDSMARDPKYLGKKKKMKKKKYPTITRGDVISYCPLDVDDTNTQHMIRYKHAGT